MLAALIEKPFDNKDWIYEIKFDGYRMISTIQNGNVEMASRNQISFSSKYPQLKNIMKKIKHNAVLDGEVVAVDSSGNPQFQLLQNYQKTGIGNIIYYVFDMLWIDGHNIENLPLVERKKLLRKIIPETNEIQYSDHIFRDGKQLFEAAQENKLEGIIAKKAESKYYENVRTKNWLKIKTHKRQEAIICGFTEPRGSRKFFGALILGVYENKKLRYIGHTGTGFNEENLKSFHKIFNKYIQVESPFEKKPKTNMPVIWMKPKLVCEIKFSNWTEDGNMRQPVFLGLREDKSPEEVVKET